MILEFRSRNRDTHTVLMNGTEVGSIIRLHGQDDLDWMIKERYLYDRTAPVWNIGDRLFPSLKEAKRHLARNIKGRYPEGDQDERTSRIHQATGHQATRAD